MSRIELGAGFGDAVVSTLGDGVGGTVSCGVVEYGVGSGVGRRVALLLVGAGVKVSAFGSGVGRGEDAGVGGDEQEGQGDGGPSGGCGA